VTQRESPPRLQGIDDDEDEEKTSVGAAPDAEAVRAASHSPLSPHAPPPRVSYGKFNTPTAFTPHQGHQVPAPGSAGPPPHAAGPPDSGPPKSQSMARPPTSSNAPSLPNARLGHTSQMMPAERGSSGPQPLTPPPPSMQGAHAQQGHQPAHQGQHQGQGHAQGLGQSGHAGVGLGGPAQSGLMPYASPQPLGGPPQQQPNVHRNDLSFGGAASDPRLGGNTLGGLGQNQPLPGTGAMVPMGPQPGSGAPASSASSGSPGLGDPRPPQSLGLRADQQPRENRASSFHITRSRAYSFVLDARGQPIELGSGRFAKAYLGEERWLESKTDYRKPIVIKILQKGVSEEDHMRFQMEKELLERVQGHPNIVELMCSGENEDLNFLPASIRDKVDTEFMILEKLEMSLEERLKGSRVRGHKEELLLCDMRERLFRVLDYMIPVSSAVEYSHLVRNICHRDIKPANILIGLPDPNLRGATLQVRLADFNVAKLSDEEVHFGMTQMKAAVPGTLFFQSPEQETNIIELLVNVQQGVPEVEYFEDFYIQIAKNDSFSLFNRDQQYPVLYADRARKRLVLGRPYRETSETNVRARIQKSVGRPADVYSLGATFYYLISGAYANPKTLYDAFHKFIEYERADENNTIEAYLRHEYSVINSLRAPKSQDGSPEVAPADRFFSYKQFLDGNGELIDPNVMLIIAKCMIRNKPDSYCQAHDLETRGISDFVADLINLYSLYGFQPGARPTHLVHRTNAKKGGVKGVGSRLKQLWTSFISMFKGKKR
jgi:serine/threonine protein kinase